ncbi:cytochrome b/b6 domain-containing protein [Pelomonas sp. P7]|uniref:Cytochrome b/b6 domain-containing protein n=1 Tax=Pelomonas caseinilytica TaxID=2906763 RepID=A0ABS8XFJ0_9BURK|nr:cytochrome b/b6 domain-containing protein [Pelomonas sp. P7]MCE4539664.1 cytochrome b/b6 domain-containing protein [Pelomonas sp. P7]
MSQPASPDATEIPVWDGLLRAFHWALVALVGAAIATALAGGDWMAWHARAGQAIGALLVLRLSWGLWGSRYARFTQFWPTPARLIGYLRGRSQGLGHNPLGALSVLAVLGLLLFQVGSGLVGNDEIAFTGPWAGAIDEDLSLKLTSWHRLGAKVLYGWIALHLAAIALHGVVRRHPLLRAMWTGRRPGDPAAAASRVPFWRVGLSVLLAAAAGVVAASPGLLGF